jgi:hypothetical protein
LEGRPYAVSSAPVESTSKPRNSGSGRTNPRAKSWTIERVVQLLEIALWAGAVDHITKPGGNVRFWVEDVKVALK